MKNYLYEMAIKVHKNAIEKGFYEKEKISEKCCALFIQK